MLRILTLAVTLFLACPALAGDWVVQRVRGEAQILVQGDWLHARAGAMLVSGTTLRTGPDGRMSLARGKEVVELASGTQVELFDEGVQRMTTLRQRSGSLVVDVERRNVQHFSVQTPYMAAVVKGTRFTVTVGRSGATVEVARGQVQVQDRAHNQFVDITPGQRASVSPQDALAVQGGRSAVIYTMDAVPTPVVPASETHSQSLGQEATPSANASNNSGNRQSDNPGRGNGNGGDSSNRQGNGNGNSAGNGSERGNGGGNGNNGGGNGNENNGGGNGNGNNGGGNGNGGDNSGGQGNGNQNSADRGNGGDSEGGNNNGNGNGNGNGGNSRNAGGNGNGRDH